MNQYNMKANLLTEGISGHKHDKTIGYRGYYKLYILPVGSDLEPGI